MSPALACLEHHCAMQTREPKREAPEGTDFSGAMQVNEFGNYAKARIRSDAWIKGTTLESWRGVILLPLLDGRTIGRSSHHSGQTAAPRGAPGSRLAAHGPLSLNGYAKGIVLILAARLSCFSILAMLAMDGMGEG
jgi:hypothetical protein